MLYATPRMKYEAIRANNQEFSVRKMCRTLGLVDSAYHQWQKRKQKQDKKKEAEKKLGKLIREVFDRTKKVYGYRRMQRALAREDIVLSENRIRRIMRENGMYPVTAIKYKPAGKGKATGNYQDNLVQQEFTPNALNMIWVGDITYVRTYLGWVYLAIVLDLYNKEVIGYSISKTIDSELVKRALANALATTGGGGKETIFHSDYAEESERTTNFIMVKQKLRHSIFFGIVTVIRNSG